MNPDESLPYEPVSPALPATPAHPVTRRSLLAAVAATAGVGALAATVGLPSAAATPAGPPTPAAPPAPADPAVPSLPDTAAGAVPVVARRGDPATTPRVQGLHLQFGADASSQVTVSWHALQSVRNPRVLVAVNGQPRYRQVAASVAAYTDAKSGQVVYAHHARIRNLAPDTDHVYVAVHDGAQPELGSFHTAPSGRAAFTFTSFGDQGTPTLGRRYVPPTGVTISNPPYVNDNLGSPAAGDTTAAVERVAPLLHLFNGDLCYANLSNDRVRTWSDFWENNTRSARYRPWMPSAGNHENELGNGAFGFRAYQTYFSMPPVAGQTADTAGLWYAFTVGSVRFISLNNDDVCYQDGGNSYVRGYSKGAQKAWLEAELRRTRSNPAIDWIVVCMHQVVISTADQFNGADLGVRQEWVPLFDRYGVDLVVCGHEHHYERSHAIRGQQPNATLTPIPRTTDTRTVDTEQGTVHMVIGGGGTSAPSNQLLTTPPVCRVITAVGEPDPTTGKRPPVYVTEPAAWSASRDAAQAYGFASFTVDPGSGPGALTSIAVTYWEVTGSYGQVQPFERFTLQRRRRDG